MEPKKKFFFLRIIEAVSKFYNLSTFKKLRSTFTYTLIRMYCVILAILWLQFQVLPRLGYIEVFQPFMADNVEISASSLDIFNNNTLTLNVHDRMKMYCVDAEFSINGIEYDDDIVIEVSWRNDKSSVILSYSSDYNMSLGSSDNNILNFYEVSEGYQHIAQIYGVDTIYSSGLDSLSVTFQECDVNIFFYERSSKGTQASENMYNFDFNNIEYKDFRFAGNISDLSFNYIYILEAVGEYSVHYTDTHERTDNSAVFYFHDVNEVTCIASGRLAFSDSPEEKEYEVDNKSVSYKFKNAEGYVDIVQGGENSVQIFSSGCVYSMEIAKYDLFPSFRNWYYNNLYIAPLTLLSIVIASIALIMKKRE
jgi:hypothetical protein